MTEDRTEPAMRTEPPRPFDAEAEPEVEAVIEEPEVEEDPEPEIVEQPMLVDVPPEDPMDDLENLPHLLEALLFVSDHPIEETYLARALEISGARVHQGLETLATQLRDGNRGIRLQRGPEGAQLVSSPEAAAKIELFLGLEASRKLSTAALETLAIIAYRQPVTRGQIDTIRGVSSDGAVATLRARGLIAPAGYATGPGRPMLFQTTQRFLEHFGLERAGQLPPLPDEIDLPVAEIGEQLGLDAETVTAALAAPAADVEALVEAVDSALAAEAVDSALAAEAADGEALEVIVAEVTVTTEASEDAEAPDEAAPAEAPASGEAASDAPAEPPAE